MLRNFGRLAPAQKRRAVLLCAVPVLGLAAVGAALAATLFAVRPPAPEQAAVEPQKTYEQRQYEREVAEFSVAFLRETEDAGEEYLQESLFVGDSNTVRLAAFGEIEMNSMAGVVGMGVQSVPTKACIWFREYAEPVTMARAAALLQPRRMIVMFGTNNTDMQPEAFIAAYEQALEALKTAIPTPTSSWRRCRRWGRARRTPQRYKSGSTLSTWRWRPLPRRTATPFSTARRRSRARTAI